MFLPLGGEQGVGGNKHIEHAGHSERIVGLPQRLTSY